MIDQFELTEEHAAHRELVREFVRHEVEPVVLFCRGPNKKSKVGCL